MTLTGSSIPQNSAKNYQDILAENARKLAADAERQAMREGITALNARRAMLPAEHQPVLLSNALAAVDQPVRRFELGMNTYSRIAQCALQQKLDGSVRLYDVLQHRARTSGGNAIFTTSEAVAYAALLGMDRGKVTRAIKPGIGIFWDVIESKPGSDRRRIVYRLRSKEKLCQYFELAGPGVLCDMPDEAYTGEHYAAFAYAAFWAKNKGEYSRSTLQKLFAVTLPALLRWEKIAGVVVTARYSYARLPENEAETAELSESISARRWVTVVRPTWNGKDEPIYTVRLLGDDNQPLPDYHQRLDNARKVAQKPGRYLAYAWQDTNHYESEIVQPSAHNRARWIVRRLKYAITSLIPGNAGQRSRTDEYPRRFDDVQKAALFQTRNTHKNCKTYHEMKVSRRAVSAGGRPYVFAYSLWATCTFPTLKPIRQARELAARYA